MDNEKAERFFGLCRCVDYSRLRRGYCWSGRRRRNLCYIDGELKRAYQANYEKTYQVCTGILNVLNQPIHEETTDGVQTTIKTERSDGTPMTIKVTILEPKWTEVSVRTGVVGLWKKDISEQFHKFVEERLIKNER